MIAGALFIAVTLTVPGAVIGQVAQIADPLAANDGIPNYHRLGENLAAAGQPTDEAIAEIHKAGYKAVLNLRRESEGSLEEKPKVEAQGMTYYNIPVGGDGFTPDMVKQFADILADNANQPLLVHCASSNRVGAMWFLHRVLNEGAGETEALAEGHDAGLRSEALEKRARDFVAAQKNPQ